jgi:hypothetical protein
MAEIIACHAGLAAEYAHMPVSYMRDEGNFQENEVMQRGVLWSVSRLTQARPELAHKWQAVRYTLPYLNSQDIVGQGLAAWALGLLKAKEARSAIRNLVGNPHVMSFYWNRSLSSITVGQLAEQAETSCQELGRRQDQALALGFRVRPHLFQPLEDQQERQDSRASVQSGPGPMEPRL